MQTFYFDISKKDTAPVLEAKQGDVGRKFKAVITDGGAAYSIPAGAQFSVWFSGPGGEGNYSAIGEHSAFSVSGNTVTVELIAQMLQNPGTGAMCLILNAVDGSQLGLWNVIYVVEHVPGMDSGAAETYYTALSELARQAIKAAETFETDTTMTVSGKAADAAAVGTALAGKAPGGYVVYEAAFSTEEALETAVATAYGRVSDGKIGFAKFTSNSNTISLVGGIWFITIYRGSAAYGLVKAVSYGGSNPSIMYKTLKNGAWGAWEWENPPMALGVEYRTTERWQGKAVYTQNVNLGTLPNAATKTLNAPSTVTRYIGGPAVTLDNGASFYGSGFDPTIHNNEHIRVCFFSASIYIITDYDASARSAHAIVKYTKD